MAKFHYFLKTEYIYKKSSWILFTICYIYCGTKCVNFILSFVEFFQNVCYTCLFVSALENNPAGNCILKVNNRNTRTRCEICSKLTIKVPERRRLESDNASSICHNIEQWDTNLSFKVEANVVLTSACKTGTWFWNKIHSFRLRVLKAVKRYLPKPQSSWGQFFPRKILSQDIDLFGICSS